MGVGDVVLRNDLQYERYNLVSAARARPRCSRQYPGSAARPGSGRRRAERCRRGRTRTSTRSRRRPNEAPPAPVVVYPVDEPDADRARRSRRSNALHDRRRRRRARRRGRGRPARRRRDRAVLRFVRDAPTDCAPRSSDDTTLVLTDSNRGPARRWSTVRDNVGVTEQPGEKPIRDRPRRRPARRVPAPTPTRHDRRWTSKVSRGRPRPATATRSPTRPRTAPRAPSTATSRPRGGPARSAPRSVRRSASTSTTRSRPTTSTSCNRINGARDRYITKVQLRFDGGDAGRRRARRRRRAPRPGRRSRSRRGTFRRLEIEVTGSNVGQPPARTATRTRSGSPRSASPTPRPARRCGCARSCGCRPICSRPPGPSSIKHPLVVLMTPGSHPAGPAAQRSRAGHRARVHAAGPARVRAHRHRAGHERGGRADDRGRAR